MSDEEKIINEVEEEITNTPSDEVIEETDATTELSDTADGDDKPGEVEEAGGDGGEPTDTDGADGEAEEPTEELDTEKQKDLSVQEGVEEKDETVENVTPTPDVDVEALRAEIDDLKYEKETNDAIAEFQNIVAKQQSEYEAFTTELQNKVVEEFNKYGIPMDMDINESFSSFLSLF